MKQLLRYFTLLFCSVFTLKNGVSQTYHMSTANGTTLTTCKGYIDNVNQNLSCTYGGYYTYCNNEDYTVTICSGTGQPVRLNLTLFSTESGYDFLYVYDGPTTASTLLTPGGLSGNLDLGGTGSSYMYYTSSGTCLTLKWHSDGSNHSYYGWSGIIGCPVSSCNGHSPADDNCSNATQICDLNGYCGNTSGWYTVDNASHLGSDYSGPFCGSIENNSWLSFTAGATSASIVMTSTNCADASYGIQAAILSGTCGGSMSLKSNCVSQGGSGNGGGQGTFTLTATSLTAGNTYYVMIDGYAGNYCDYTMQASTGVSVYTVSAAATSVCSGSSTTLSVTTGASSYAWTASTSSAISGSTTSATITATPTTTTTYSCSIVGNTGCTTVLTKTITVNSLPTVTVNSPTTCAGTTVTLTGSGASTYSWSTSATTSTISVNPGSTTSYTVTGTSAAGCKNTAASTVTVNSLPTVTVNSPTICAGSSANLTGSGANTYSWSTSSTSNPISVSPGSTTSYTVTGTDGNGCKNTATSTVTVNSLPTVTVNSPTTCVGTAVTLTGSGASTYSWSTSATTSTISVNPGSTTSYTVTGTSAAGCTNTATSTVTVNSLPTVTVNSPTICAGSSTNLTGSGASTYSWSTSSTSNPISVSPGSTTSYTVTGTDGNGCKNTATSIVTVNSLPTPSISSVSNGGTLTCTSPSITATASPSSGVTYSWSGPSGYTSPAQTATITTPGTYSLVVTDNSTGCQSSVASTATIAITSNGAIPTYTVTSSTSTYTVNCTNTSIVITGTPSSGATGTWAGAFGAIAGNTFTVSAATIGTYTYNVVDGGSGCSTSTQTTIQLDTAHPVLSITPSATTITCSTPTISLTGNSNPTGISYSWSGPGGYSSSTLSPPAASLGGIYILNATNTVNGCTQSVTQTIATNTTAPNVSYTTSTNTLTCSSQTITATGTSSTGGATLSWSGGLSDPASISAAGTYTLTASDPLNGCTHDTTLTVSQNITVPNVSSSASTQTLTCGASTATLTASSTTPGATFAWSGSGGAIGGNPVTVSAPDTYTVVATDPANGCTAISTQAIASNGSLPTVSAQSNTNTYTLTCSTTTISLTGSGTISGPGSPVVTWSDASGTIPGNPIIVSTGGTYTVTVTDPNNGCSSSQPVTVSINNTPPSTPTITSSGNNTYCQGDVILSIIASANGDSVLWYTDPAYTNEVYSGSSYTPPATTQTYYLLDSSLSNGCKSTASTTVAVTVNATPTVSISSVSSSSICAGGSVIITPSGATTYTLNPGSQTGTGFTVSPTTSTTYTINGTNTSTGCSNAPVDQALQSVMVSPTPTISASVSGGNNTICNGASIVITPSGASTYTLNPGNQSGISFTVSPSINTTYTISGMDNASGCSNASGDEAVQTVSVSPTPTIAATVPGGNTAICNAGIIVITPSGASTYTLNPGNQTGTSFTVSPNVTTTYTISGTDNTSGCTSATGDDALQTISVSPTPTITSSVQGGINTICQGEGSVIITPSGATIYTLNPGGQTGTSFTVSPLSSTTYTIDGTDNTSGCANQSADAGIQPVTVNPLPQVDLSTAILDSAKCGNATGGIEATSNNVSGGTPTYIYQWYDGNGQPVPGATSLTLANVNQGTYSLQVTDANGCYNQAGSGNSSLTVPSSAALSASFIINPDPATGVAPLIVTFTNTTTGGSSNNTYSWNMGDGITFNTLNAAYTYTNAGSYTVMLTAANGTCPNSTYTATVIVDEPTSIVIPNIYSPNGDGKNDMFYIITTGMKDLHCDILNRWGQHVFTINAPDQGWDGKLANGDNASEGTYFFILEAHGEDGKDYKKQGTLTLVR